MKINMMGGEHDLSLPFGAQEDIARVNPRLQKLYESFFDGSWTMQELRAIIEAAIKWSDAKSLTFAALVEYEGLARMREIAFDLFADAWISEDDRKKPKAPTTESGIGANGSTSESGSPPAP